MASVAGLGRAAASGRRRFAPGDWGSRSTAGKIWCPERSGSAGGARHDGARSSGVVVQPGEGRPGSPTKLPVAGGSSALGRWRLSRLGFLRLPQGLGVLVGPGPGMGAGPQRLSGGDAWVAEAHRLGCG